MLSKSLIKTLIKTNVLLLSQIGSRSTFLLLQMHQLTNYVVQRLCHYNNQFIYFSQISRVYKINCTPINSSNLVNLKINFLIIS